MQVPAIPPQHYEGGHPISGCQRDGGDRDTVPHLVVLRRRAHIRGSSKNGRLAPLAPLTPPPCGCCFSNPFLNRQTFYLVHTPSLPD